MFDLWSWKRSLNPEINFNDKNFGKFFQINLGIILFNHNFLFIYLYLFVPVFPSLPLSPLFLSACLSVSLSTPLWL